MVATVTGAPVVSTVVNANSLNVTMPSGVVAGELLQIIVGTYLATAISEPAGWNTGIASTSDGYGNTSAAMFWKIAVGDESGTTVSVPFSTAVNATAMSRRLSGVSATPDNASGSNSGVDNASVAMTAPAVTTTVDGCLIERFAVTRQASDILVPAGQTDIGYASAGANFDQISIRGVSAEQSTAGNTGTVVLQTADSNRPWVTMTFAVAPGSGGGEGGGGGGGSSPTYSFVGVCDDVW